MRERMTYRPRGFGFVTLPNKRSMEDAIRDLHDTKVDGKVISVREAIPQDQPHPPPFRERSRAFGEGGDRQGGYMVRRDPPRRGQYPPSRGRFPEGRNGSRMAPSGSFPRKEGPIRRDPRPDDRGARRDYDYGYEDRAGAYVERDGYGREYERSYAADNDYTNDRTYDTYSRDTKYEQEQHYRSGSYNPRQEYTDSEYPAETYDYYDRGYGEYDTRYEDNRTYAAEGRTSYATEYESASRPLPARDVRPQRPPPRASQGRLPPPRTGGPDRKRDTFHSAMRPVPYDKTERLEKRRKTEKPERVMLPSKDRRDRRS